MARRVQSGLITANMETTETGVLYFGPLEFDEEVVCQTGRWERRVNPDDDAAVADALIEIYSSEFDDWCARKAAARAAVAETPRVSVAQVMPHTPCPVLWAGR